MKELLETLNKPLEGSLTQEEQDELFVLSKRYTLMGDLMDTFAETENVDFQICLENEAGLIANRIKELNAKY